MKGCDSAVKIGERVCGEGGYGVIIKTVRTWGVGLTFGCHDPMRESEKSWAV